jgi:hypothetical protein
LTIADGDRFRAEGEFIDIVMNIFFECLLEQNNGEDRSMIVIEDIQNKRVEEVHAILKRERLTMTAGYRNSSYICILRPRYRARTNVVLGRADTYIGVLMPLLERPSNF